jgi:hypothetical protein
MMFILLTILFLLLLDIASYYWGVDTTDKIDSGEWKRRRQYDERKATREKHSGRYASLAEPFAQRTMGRQAAASYAVGFNIAVSSKRIERANSLPSTLIRKESNRKSRTCQWIIH